MVNSFATLLANPDLPRAYLAKVSAWDTVGSAVVSYYFSSGSDKPLYDGFLWRARLLTVLDISSSLGDLHDPSGTMSGGRIEVSAGDGDLDALRAHVWEGHPVIVYMGDPLGTFADFSPVLTGHIGASSWTINTLRLVLRDARLPLTKNIQTSAFLGTGGIEGPADLKGKLKPLAFGVVRNAEPVVTDQTNLVMRLHERAINSIIQVAAPFDKGAWDRGVGLTAAAGDAADYAALLAWTPVAGQYKTCLTLGLIRLGARPDGPVTVDFEGEASGSYVSTASEIIKRITEWKASTVTIDTAAFSSVQGSRPWNSGIYLRDGEGSIQDAIDRLARSIGAWTQIAADGKLTIGIIAFGTPVLTLNETDYAGMQAIDTPPHPSLFRIGYQRSWLVQELEAVDTPIIESGDIAAGAVTAPALGAGAVTAPAIAAAAVTNPAIASSAVATANIVAAAVTGHVLNEDTTSRAINVVRNKDGLTNAQTTISFVANNTINRSAGNFLTDGFIAGEVVVITGSASNNGTFTLATVGATSMTITGTNIVNESAGASVTIRENFTLTPYNNSTATTVHTISGVVIDSTGDFIEVEFTVFLSVTNFAGGYESADGDPIGDAVHMAIYDGATQLRLDTSNQTITAGGVDMKSDGTLLIPATVHFATGLSVGSHTFTLKAQVIDMHDVAFPPTTVTVTRSIGKARVYKK